MSQNTLVHSRECILNHCNGIFNLISLSVIIPLANVWDRPRKHRKQRCKIQQIIRHGLQNNVSQVSYCEYTSLISVPDVLHINFHSKYRIHQSIVQKYFFLSLREIRFRLETAIPVLTYTINVMHMESLNGCCFERSLSFSWYLVHTLLYKM